MSDKKVLQEMALNRREISHDVWGSFIISRPTNKVLSKIETARTKALNKDLQTTVKVEDEDGVKEVPAILTRKSKEKLLRLHEEWTNEDDDEAREAELDYQRICAELDEAGFTGIDFINDEYTSIHEALKTRLGKDYEEHEDTIRTVIPVLIDEPREEETEEEVVGSFVNAKEELEAFLQDLSLSETFSRLDVLHKQYRLYLKGLVSQTRLYAIKLKEITLFSDTVEARADKAGQVVKIVECVKNKDGSYVWGSTEQCEEEEPDKLSWLLGQVERFERLDPTEEVVDERVRNRFNFLFPLGATSTLLGESGAQRESKEDGELPENEQESSTEDSDTSK